MPTLSALGKKEGDRVGLACADGEVRVVTVACIKDLTGRYPRIETGGIIAVFPPPPEADQDVYILNNGSLRQLDSAATYDGDVLVQIFPFINDVFRALPIQSTQT